MRNIGAAGVRENKSTAHSDKVIDQQTSKDLFDLFRAEESCRPVVVMESERFFDARTEIKTGVKRTEPKIPYLNDIANIIFGNTFLCSTAGAPK